MAASFSRGGGYAISTTSGDTTRFRFPPRPRNTKMARLSAESDCEALGDSLRLATRTHFLTMSRVPWHAFCATWRLTVFTQCQAASG